MTTKYIVINALFVNLLRLVFWNVNDLKCPDFFYLIESEKIYVTYVLSSVNILTFDKGGRRFASPRPERPLKSQNWFNPTELFCKNTYFDSTWQKKLLFLSWIFKILKYLKLTPGRRQNRLALAAILDPNGPKSKNKL